MAEERKHIPWSEEEDTKLKEYVIETVKGNGTQKQAFEKFSAECGRTFSSVAFRWNNKLRKIYAEDLRLAKEFKKENKAVKTKSETNNESQKESHSLTIDKVVNFIYSSYKMGEKYRTLFDEHQKLLEEYNELKNKFRQIEEMIR